MSLKNNSIDIGPRVAVGRRGGSKKGQAGPGLEPTRARLSKKIVKSFTTELQRLLTQNTKKLKTKNLLLIN